MTVVSEVPPARKACVTAGAIALNAAPLFFTSQIYKMEKS